MKRIFRKFKNSNWQTKIFILNLAIYMIAIIWTTLQAYARLEYSRSDDMSDPIVIQAKQPSDS